LALTGNGGCRACLATDIGRPISRMQRSDSPPLPARPGACGPYANSDRRADDVLLGRNQTFGLDVRLG
jgi:hypothetical protein